MSDPPADHKHFRQSERRFIFDPCLHRPCQDVLRCRRAAHDGCCTGGLPDRRPVGVSRLAGPEFGIAMFFLCNRPLTYIDFL
jgi:hypothetical protein